MINLRVVLGVFLCAALAVGCASAASPTGPSAAPPTISPSDLASPSLSAVVPEMTETLISSNYGYSVRYPDSGTIEPATSLWSPANAPWPDGAFDYTKSELSGVFRAASATVPEGVSIDDWIDAFITNASVGSCNPPRSTLPEITIDGQLGRIRDGCPEEVEATVVVGRRAYVFTLFRDASNKRAVFDAIAATIDLRPEEAQLAGQVLGSGSYPGYSVKVPDGWSTTGDGHFVVKNAAAVTGLSVWDVDRVPMDPCHWEGRLYDPGQTVDDLVRALVAQPMRQATKPIDVTLAGYPGQYLEWSVPADMVVTGDADFEGCDVEPSNGHRDFISWLSTGGSSRYQQVAGQVDRLWIVDVAGQRLVVDATYSPDTTQVDRDELSQVVESLRFVAP